MSRPVSAWSLLPLARLPLRLEVTYVPEPSTATLLLGGLGMLALRGRRGRH